MGTRQTGFDNPLRNAPILDNQWLGLLLEVGAIGVLGWAWLIVRCIRRLAHASRTRAGPDGWLAAGYAGAIASFSIGMFTYDSLSFIQVAFVFWVILALSASLLMVVDRDPARLGNQASRSEEEAAEIWRRSTGSAFRRDGRRLTPADHRRRGRRAERRRRGACHNTECLSRCLAPSPSPMPVTTDGDGPQRRAEAKGRRCRRDAYPSRSACPGTASSRTRPATGSVD